MEIKAIQKFVRMSPKKLRVVTYMIKNLKPIKAIEILPHIEKKAAEPLIKVIKTAIANAKQKKVSENDLVFKEIQINEGPRLKRWRAGARGLVKPYKRRMSHIRVVLETREPEPIKESREKLIAQKAQDKIEKEQKDEKKEGRGGKSPSE